MGPWSRLERRLRDLPDPALDLRFRFTAYRQATIETPHFSESACKLWITQGKRTLWAVPRDRHSGDDNDIGGYARRSPAWLVELAVEYLQLPRSRLIDWQPEWSGWGLVDVLKASDRRLGKRQWPQLAKRLQEPVALHLLDLRAGRPTRARVVAGGRDAHAMHDPD